MIIIPYAGQHPEKIPHFFVPATGLIDDCGNQETGGRFVNSDEGHKPVPIPFTYSIIT
jgi:hypothetical protein